MRVLSGWFVLIALFAVAGWVHRGWAEGLRRERAGLGVEAAEGREPGPARIVIGRPAGTTPLADWPVPSAPLPAPEAATLVEAAGPDSAPAFDELDPAGLGLEADLPPPTPVFEVTVRPGQVLSRICEDFYGTGRPPLPELVARYNGLADEHSLRAGQTLELPPREQLQP
ncbi:MAG: hypothetical protein QF903_11365 [Planctomycetota bacterium]|nr:hypothetical protein [Planctomycetota bacterium]MDP6762175.1 hypothetical protein [Planctomycetota bacterium]MDP6990063.1 hypothetical protein [Planctomycetota bacterium]